MLQSIYVICFPTPTFPIQSPSKKCSKYGNARKEMKRKKGNKCIRAIKRILKIT